LAPKEVVTFLPRPECPPARSDFPLMCNYCVAWLQLGSAAGPPS
jgi:hypothetical protein